MKSTQKLVWVVLLSSSVRGRVNGREREIEGGPENGEREEVERERGRVVVADNIFHVQKELFYS